MKKSKIIDVTVNYGKTWFRTVKADIPQHWEYDENGQAIYHVEMDDVMNVLYDKYPMLRDRKDVRLNFVDR